MSAAISEQRRREVVDALRLGTVPLAGAGCARCGLGSRLGGQPHVAVAVKRRAGIRGDLDHDGALGFLRGLLAVLGDSDHAGLVVVLDEVETLQRVRSDVRDKGLNGLRQLVDYVDAGRFPGLVLVITGTPAFFDGPPLARRLHVDFPADPRFDNPRAVQVRLPGFTRDSLVELGAKGRCARCTWLAVPRLATASRGPWTTATFTLLSSPTT